MKLPALFLLLALAAQVQPLTLKVTTDRPEAIYKAGETATFTIEASQPAEVTLIFSKDGVQLYTIGSRNLQRYQTSLASVQDMIAKLQKRVRELEAELAGGSARRAVGVVPRDW